MKKVTLFIFSMLLVCAPINAAQQYTEECVRDFQDLVFDKLTEENRINVYHQIWFWVPGKILQGEREFTCTDWATNNGISSANSENVELLSKACADLKKYSEKLLKEFKCPQRTI